MRGSVLGQVLVFCTRQTADTGLDRHGARPRGARNGLLHMGNAEARDVMSGKASPLYIKRISRPAKTDEADFRFWGH